MELFINGENIPFELENEENINDIVLAVSDFSSKSNPPNFITSLNIDDKEYPYTDEDVLKNILIKDVKSVEIETSDIIGVAILSINQIQRFLSHLSNMLEKNAWDNSLINVEESINWIKDGINQLISLFGVSKQNLHTQNELFVAKVKNVEKIFSEIDKDSFPLEESDKEEYISLIHDLQNIINTMQISIDNSYVIPSNEDLLNAIDQISDKIDKLLPELEKIPMMFQSGDDKNAMDIIQEITVVMENTINLFVVFKESFQLDLDSFLEGEPSFENFFSSLTNYLKELMGAIENNDSVMIGDLLEYEFIPNLEEIKTILNNIKTHSFTKTN